MVLSRGIGWGTKSTCGWLTQEERQQKIVPKLYPSSGNGAFFALLAINRINNLRVFNTPQKFDPD